MSGSGNRSDAAANVRKATHADIARLVQLRLAVAENRLRDANSVTDADYAWFIAHGEIWVWEEGNIEGFAAGDTRDATIWALFVDPAHEGRGIGRTLIECACSTLRRAGHRQARLSTEPDTRADRFYRRNGWAVAGRNAKGELVFQKQI
jgi:GNAT superfamily N-acetyltransferase